jgi:hypothetical protein
MEGLGVMTSPGKHANVPMVTNYRSHLWEQLPPVSAWGETFVATPLETRAAYTLRIVAAEDNTAISVNGAPTFLLHRRQLYQDTYSAAAQIGAEATILVAQYSHGSEDDGTTADPFMALVAPVEDGGLHQKGLDAWRLLCQDFFNQVIQYIAVAAGKGFYEGGFVLPSLH